MPQDKNHPTSYDLEEKIAQATEAIKANQAKTLRVKQAIVSYRRQKQAVIKLPATLPEESDEGEEDAEE